MPQTLSPDVLARIDKLELEARQVVEGYLAGRHRSPRHGFAVEFAQHREYAPGDDVRHMDWKVYARTERYHLKQYEQETNLVAWLIVDASESMRVSTVRGKDGNPVAKYDVACVLAGALAYLITRQSDSVGFHLYADRPRVGLRPSGSQGQVREILRGLSDGPFPTLANTGQALRELGGSLGRRGIVFVISDLLDDPDEFATGLRILRSQKHEVVVFQVLDAAELDFPFRHPTLFRGLEDLPEISTDPLSVRDSYLAELGKHLAAVEAVCHTMATDLVRVRTDDDLSQVLAGYLQKRRGK
ncbi:DUF58 domain-containing protein [Fimbriiglobus ruber]|uniref:DUF58 domain-containing protein n=1 Tax=Fimbriiglobus ruber TaxID=1908690 RepID=A0A225DRP2_9BACT|nr:DUF58 domain-containing protein [Fimbriiglobus ruber]OWK39045.1 hypothetical protein FRUB_06127 [Fimbriiglobus ruber]